MCDQLNGCGDIAIFFYFRHGGRPPFWIFEICKFSLCARSTMAICMLEQNFASIGWMVAEILQIFDFQYGVCPPCWICEICKFQHFTRFIDTICMFTQYFVTRNVSPAKARLGEFRCQTQHANRQDFQAKTPVILTLVVVSQYRQPDDRQHIVTIAGHSNATAMFG